MKRALRRGARLAGVVSLGLAWCAQAQVQLPAVPFSMVTPAEADAARGDVTRTRLTLVFPAGLPAVGSFEVFHLVPERRAHPGAPAWRLVERVRPDPTRGIATLAGVPGDDAVVVIVSASGGYHLDGLFRWPGSDSVRRVAFERRRTLRGTMPEGVGSAASIVWLDRTSGVSAGVWPQCRALNARQWECVGVPWGESGVVIVEGTTPLQFGVVAASGETALTIQPVLLSSAPWCRWVDVVLSDAPWLPLDDVAIVPRRPLRAGATRTVPVLDARARVAPVGPAAFWVCGPSDHDALLFEVRGAALVTRFVDAVELALGPSEIRHQVEMEAALSVSGVVVDAAGRPAASTEILVSEILDSDERPGSDARGEGERRRLVAETSSTADGRFEVGGLARRRYELAAVHPSLGRAVLVVSPSARPLVVTLVAARRVRGRVLRDGSPAARVPVVALPELGDVQVSADRLDHYAPPILTAADGRFELTLPSAARRVAELRIGREDSGIVRVRLPLGDPTPAVLDLGDIALPGVIRLHIAVAGGSGCDPYAAGPFGRAALTIVRGDLELAGTFLFRLPEPGRWLLGVRCGRREAAVSPPFVDVEVGESELYREVVVIER